MRYYDIVITPARSSAFAGTFVSPLRYSTLFSNGRNNTQALKIDVDIPQAWYYQPSGLGYVKIYGVSFEDLNQSANLNPDFTNDKYANIQIKIGMSKGLPFANPEQQGLVINGSILQAFGNWQGNLVTLDLVITNSQVSPSATVNLSFNWKKDTFLGDAIKETLQNAYPKKQTGLELVINGSISSNLKATENQTAQYTNLESFSKYLNITSKDILKLQNYAGVSLTATPLGFYLYDGTTSQEQTVQNKIITVNFQDIIGNLTWLDLFTIQAKLTMRGDVQVGNQIIFPKKSPIVNTAASALTQLRNNVSFNGQFQINKIRHVGSSRQTDGNSWVTVLDCVVLPNLPPSVTNPVKS